MLKRKPYVRLGDQWFIADSLNCGGDLRGLNNLEQIAIRGIDCSSWSEYKYTRNIVLFVKGDFYRANVEQWGKHEWNDSNFKPPDHLINKDWIVAKNVQVIEEDDPEWFKIQVSFSASLA